jgi:hypothetical protein
MIQKQKHTTLNTEKSLGNLSKKLRKQHHSKLIAKSKNKTKTKWNIIKKETSKVYSLEHVPIFLVDDTKLQDLTHVNNTFNNSFITITKKLNIQHVKKGDAVSILKIHFLETSPA